MTQYEKLGVALAQERERKGKTQADVAKFLGISAQAISGWERGQRKIDSVSLLKLLLWLGCDIYAFLDRCDFEFMHKLNSTTPELERSLMTSFCSLNETGQKEACKRVDELAKIKEYTENPTASAASAG